MNAQKLRRKLVSLCIGLFVAWVITTFSLMVLWYAKGEGHGLPPEASDSWRLFIFNAIPSLTAGYLIIARCLLDLIFKAKKSEEIAP